MAKKSISSILIENMDFLEKQLTLSLPNVVNVTRLAHLFLAHQSSGSLSVIDKSEVANSTSIYHQVFSSPPSDTEVNEESLTGWQFLVQLVVQFYCDTFNWTAQSLIICLIVYVVNRALWKSKLLSFFPKFIASWLGVLLAAPVGLPFLVVTLGGRGLTAMYLRLRFKDRIFLAHPMDASWAFEKFGSPSTCTGLYVIQGKCDYEKILRRMEHCMQLRIGSDQLLMFERMRYALRTVLGYVCWERLEDFDLRRQVKLIADQNPKMTGPTGVTELFAELQRIHDKPFSDPDTAPWEILVIPDYIHDGKRGHYALVFRIHHSVMDGVSTGNALHTGIADEPFKFSVDPVAPLKANKFQQMMAYFLAVWMIPMVTIKNLLLVEKHRFHGPQLRGKKNFAWTKAVRLDTVKVLKARTKTSVFAVLMTCIGGSMRKLFIVKNEPIPQVIHAAPPVAILPFPNRMLRNRFSIVIFPIQIGMENLLDRLGAVYRAAQVLASSNDILANFYIMNLLGMFPLPIIKFLGNLAHATMTLSNIPGPAELVRLFDGDLLVDVGAWVPVKNTIGIGMALFSYADRVRITIVADEACLPEPEDVRLLQQGFEDELVEMAARVGIKEQVFF